MNRGGNLGNHHCRCGRNGRGDPGRRSGLGGKILAHLGGKLVDVHEHIAAALAELVEPQHRFAGVDRCQGGVGAGAVAEQGQAAGDHIVGVQVAAHLNRVFAGIKIGPANHCGRLADARGHHVHDAFVEEGQVFF